MKDKINTPRTTAAGPSAPWRALPVLGALALAVAVQGQVMLQEDFTGGESTSGFTIDATGSDCPWVYAPGGLTAGTFNVDFEGEVPAGAGFDSDFAFLDSDDCGASGVIVNSFLISPPFDASAPSNYILSFDHQFRARLESFARVEVFNGSDWVQVANYTGADVGYPNPAASESINITDATGGSDAAQVRFQFNAGWDWWWAIDNIIVEMMDCAPPPGLAATDFSTEGAMFSWDDNGSAGYEWAVTTGEEPDGTNEAASGDGSNTIATGLNSGATYMVWVRAECGDGTFSPWSSGVPFTTFITNDDCDGAIALTVNPNYNCAVTTTGTVEGATGSGITSTCGGTPNDDVWFSFVATDTLHRISLTNITGSTSDMYMALWTGGCAGLELVPLSCSDPQTMNIGGLSVGTTYYLQVYTWTSTAGQTSVFDVCVGTEPFCQPPLDITLDNIEAPDATVTWTDNTATEYEYELRVSGAVGSGATGLVDAGSVSGSPLDLTGLVADSLYVLYVRSICSPGDTSAWSSGLDIIDGYCNTFAIGNTVEPICNVTFAGINNDSPSAVGGTTPAIENFTSLVASVEQGGTYTISATGNTGGDWTNHIAAFFDWDQDNVFEVMVPLGSFSNTVCGTVVSATVEVPADAALGQSRMRVVKNFNVAPTDACGTYAFGQAEDYTVEVSEHVAVPDCEGVPDGPALPGTPCTASSGFGGTWSDDCECEENVGIAELVEAQGVSVHPNPASTELFLATASGLPVYVKVYDMVGHLALERQVVERMDISQLAPGSYSLLITDGSGQLVARTLFVKQ